MAKGKTLAEHAAYELHKAGFVDNDDPDVRKVATDTMALCKRFEKQKHSEKTAGATLEFFETLASFLPLTPLTNDPSEWEIYEEVKRNPATQEEIEKRIIWHSERASSIFSFDEGKTWADMRTNKTGELVDHKEYAAQQKKDADEATARKEMAAQRAANPKPIGTVDATPAAEQGLADPEPTVPDNGDAAKDNKE